MPIRSRDKGPCFLQGAARGHGPGDSLSYSCSQDQSHHDQESKPGQVWRSAELGPLQFHAEATPLGIAELLLQAHPSVIESHDVRQGIGQIRAQPPGPQPSPFEPTPLGLGGERPNPNL